MMILDISDREFKKVFDDSKLFLPIRWNGNDFSETLKGLFDYYIDKIDESISQEWKGNVDLKIQMIPCIQRICGLLRTSVDEYLRGFPSKAYSIFSDAMRQLMDKPLRIYYKSDADYFRGENYEDRLKLFRVVKVNDNKPYDRTRVFHTPYYLRSKVSTCRYSIAGYPSLYLGTSLRLCCEEIHLHPKDLGLASLFQLDRNIEYTNTSIRVIELGIKPQDFLGQERLAEHELTLRRTQLRNLLSDNQVRVAYLLWYPLIAASSYIRVAKEDPFAAEYIIPQLLMQWVRIEMSNNNESDSHQNELIGIRYFSCASERASEMGFNYVFPTSGCQISHQIPYCSILEKAFVLSLPKYIHEYESVKTCENDLKQIRNLKHINDTVTVTV